MSTIGPLWIVVLVVGSVGIAVSLVGAGVLFWLIWRAGSKKPQRQ